MAVDGTARVWSARRPDFPLSYSTALRQLYGLISEKFVMLGDNSQIMVRCPGT